MILFHLGVELPSISHSPIFGFYDGDKNAAFTRNSRTVRFCTISTAAREALSKLTTQVDAFTSCAMSQRPENARFQSGLILNILGPLSFFNFVLTVVRSS